jgi:Uma2 family endonuclease
MGALTSVGPISIEEYLTNPAYRHYEYVEGQPIQLHVGTKDHSRIQVKCSRKLDEYFDSHPGGYVAAELHCRLKIRGEVRFRLPDIAVVLGPDTSPDSRYLDRAPDLVVEIRSPEDTVAAQLRKFDEYFENGTKMAWLILPEERSVIVAEPGKAARTVITGETLDAGHLLPDLRILVQELFG